MPFGILLVAGIVAIVLGYMEFKFHPLVGIVTQIVSFLVVLGVFLASVGYDFGIIEFFVANVFLAYVFVIALGLAIGNTIAEVF